jgi:hypothetical protein
MSKVIETGDIYFLYRHKVDVEQAHSLDDIQRFHQNMLPDKAKKGRLFLLGKKRMPEIVKGKSKSTEREG